MMLQVVRVLVVVLLAVVFVGVVVIGVDVVVVDCPVPEAVVVLLHDALLSFPSLSTNSTSFPPMYLSSLVYYVVEPYLIPLLMSNLFL